MLELTGVRAGYGTFQALFDVSIEVREGEAVGVIGPNGAGKTTLMRVISGLIRPSAGSIVMEGVDLAAIPSHRIVELGIAHVPESRRLFPRMTVEDNLKMGGFMPAARPKFRERLEVVYTRFPRLAERRRQLAGTMSGGEQQMCAIGRALMSDPKLLLLDEPSAGLAPGPTIGAVITILLAEVLRISFGTRAVGWDNLVYGVLLVVFIIFLPKGILGSLLDLKRTSSSAALRGAPAAPPSFT